MACGSSSIRSVMAATLGDPATCGKERARSASKDGPPMKRSGSTTQTAPHEAGGHQSLSAYIQARFDEFSRSQKDVAQYIVDHLDDVAFQTAEELARRANTSSSTVVRFSQALGFEGFPELQASAREEYRRRVAAGEVGGGGTSVQPLFSLDQNEFETAIAADHVNVEETARKVSRSDVEASVEAIAESHRVLVVGTDQMAFFASYLRHLLMLLDVQAEIVASPSQEALSRLGRIDEDTVVVGLSRRAPAPARHAGDEDRAPPQGQDDRDHRRDAVGHREARAAFSSTTRRTRRPTSAPTPRS